jgi:hypothetical protein
MNQPMINQKLAKKIALLKNSHPKGMRSGWLGGCCFGLELGRTKCPLDGSEGFAKTVM